ncbi:hypothetical protein KIPB_013168 [Kipferlia bialata]|uniref:Uncharacterized protein n=1 Tax=Kipferlia bialata TaxID=797122 RepID=A0A391NRU4_9EUKA|nr:hypothetical protein KIPB_013168 [Kipferlia bialata]|eukprot:g13168.t1
MQEFALDFAETHTKDEGHKQFASCKFCQIFPNDMKKYLKKRKDKPNTVKLTRWLGPFDPRYFKRHLQNVHEKRWIKYCKAESGEERAEVLRRPGQIRFETKKPDTFRVCAEAVMIARTLLVDDDKILALHESRLFLRYSEDFVYAVERERKELRREVRRSPDLSDALLKAGNTNSFEIAWGPVSGKYPALEAYATGVGSVMPGSSGVERDFSLINSVKNKYRTLLSCFSLEGVLQCKQSELLDMCLDDLQADLEQFPITAIIPPLPPALPPQ